MSVRLPAWLGTGGARRIPAPGHAWGYGGQFIFVVPDLELTVVTTSHPDAEREGDHLRAVRQLLRDGIVPAAEVGARARATRPPQRAARAHRARGMQSLARVIS
jgi:hypothetical protein